MKMIKKILPFALSIWMLASCAASAPLLVTDNTGQKLGKAEFSVILGIFRPMSADISIAKAAKNGGITKVATVDMVVKGGLFKTTYTTVVTGN
jgi:uncharacterized lipoprotein YajG